MIQSWAGQEAASEVRVILVGATGLDATLRRDPSIELIRSRTPLDAIGELADPIDDTSPTRSVVIVGPDGGRTDPSQVRQFIDGLRLIDPHVRVLRLRGNPALPGEAAMFDAEVGGEQSPDELLAVIRGTRRTPRPAMEPVAASSAATTGGEGATAPSAPGVVPAAHPPAAPDAPRANGLAHPDSPDAPATPRIAYERPAPEPARETPPRDVPPASAARPPAEAPSPPAPAPRPAPRDADPDTMLLERKPARLGIGDEHLAAEVVRGRDPRSLAMDILRARLGNRRVDLIERSDSEGERRLSSDPIEAAIAGAISRAIVRWGEHHFGVLEADGVPAADLQRHADWLATWLRLGEQHKEMREAAYRDPLTGAWNRRYFDRFFSAALAKSRDGRHNLTLLVFDIDDFKVYNDRYGHTAGDEILIEVVKLLQATVRPTDRVCRIGGDEFAVVFYEPTGPRAAGSRHPTSFFDIAKRFQKQVWEHRFPKLGAQAPGTLTISGGLATFPWDGTSVAELLERADRLALDSKRLGKNAITLGPGAMRACGEGE